MNSVVSETWPVVKERSEAMLAVLVEHADMILPPLALFIAQGPFSLRVWTAAQHLSAPLAKADSEKKPQSWMKSPLVLALAMFLGFNLSAWSLRPDQSWTFIVYASLFCTMATPVVTPVILTALGIDKLAVIRNTLGLPMLYSVSSDTRSAKALKVLTTHACFVLTFFAFVMDSAACRVVVYFALLHSLAQMRSQKVQSIRKIVLASSAIMAALAIVFVSLTFFEGRSKDAKESDSDEESSYLDAARLVQKYTNWWSSIYWASLAQAFIAICYRFDFDNANLVESITASDSTEKQILTEVTTPLAPGVLLPERTSITTNFSKPYYMTTLAAWVFGNIIFIYLNAVGFVRYDGDDTVYGMLAAIVAIPFMILSILGLAAVRGEFKDMWMYQEKWGVAPVAAKPADGDASAEVEEVEPLLVDISEKA